MPQNGEYVWTARPFARLIPPSSMATGRPRLAPWWEWTVMWIWTLEGDYWHWWYEASGQSAAYALGHKHGASTGAENARREILHGIDAVVGKAK
jgi:hypothetical protein